MIATLKIKLADVRKIVRKQTPTHLVVGRVHRAKVGYSRQSTRRAERNWHQS